MKKYYPTIIVAVLFLGLFFYFKKFEQHKKVQPEGDESEVVFYLPEKEINKIILNRNKKIIELSWENNKWMITKPGKFNTDEPQVNELVQALKEFTVDRMVAENVKDNDLKTYKLDKLEVEVEVFTPTKNYKILIGGKSPLGTNYLKLDKENKIYTVASWRAEKFFKELKNLRDKKIVKIVKNNLTRIKLGVESKSIELKNFNGKWKIVFPIQKDYPKDDLESFLNYMGGFQIEDFITDKPMSLGMYGLATKINYLTFINKDKSVTTLILGRKENNKYYIGLAGQLSVYAVSEYLYNRIKEIVNRGLQPEKINTNNKTKLNNKKINTTTTKQD